MQSSKHPFPENLSFEEILSSVGEGVLLNPTPKHVPAVDTSMTVTEACEAVFGTDYALRRMQKLHPETPNGEDC